MLKQLEKVAKKLLEGKKGILAADESVKTMNKRLEAVKIEPTFENRFLWREIILKTKGIEKMISGIIFYDETLRQPLTDGKNIFSFLKEKGILAGIKVDEGLYFFNDRNESFTLGLDRLSKKLEEYKNLGCVFSKWRAVYKIGAHLPTKAALTANAIDLARYALISQKNGLLPVVEPEVLVLEGKHNIEKSYQVMKMVLQEVFFWLKEFGVHLQAMLLKTNMVLPARESNQVFDPQEIAQKTVNLLKETVDERTGGIVFLSGGLTPDEATLFLGTMNKLYKNLPWHLSFSFGRALQEEGLKTWAGKKENVFKAQEKLYHRAVKVFQARSGKI